MSLQTNNIYEFEQFRLDFSEKTLSNEVGLIPIAPKVFDTLCLLVENAGHLIEKDELMQKLWLDRFVEESNLTFNIKMLRRALGDDAHKPQFIETVQSRGYRFIAEVNEVSQTGTAAPAILQPFADAPSVDLLHDEISAPPDTHVKRPTRMILFTVGFATAVFLVFMLSFNFRSGSSGGPNEIRSIAVLPLKPINGANRDEIYEIGIADSMIIKLGSMKGIVARPLSATRKYADIEQDAIAAGKEQQVDYVLASNYQIYDGKIKITSQLINVASGQIDESYNFEKEALSVFAIQDAVAAEFGKKLMTRFGGTATNTATRRGTTNEEAYRLFLQGMILIDQPKPQNRQKAIENFEHAVTLDPNYALAWAGLARAHLAAAGAKTYFDSNEELQKTKEALTKALELDPNLSEAYSVSCSFEDDFAAQERACSRALELDPNSPVAHRAYSGHLVCRGRFDEAIAEIKTAIELDPKSYFNQRSYANHLYFARRYEEAVAQYKRMIELSEEAHPSYEWLIRTLEAQGNESEAFEWFLKLLVTVRKTDNETIQLFKTIYQRSGWRGVLQERERTSDGNDFRVAGYNARLGNIDKSFEYLERSYQQHDGLMATLQVEPQFDPLRSDPRFDELVRRVGLK